MKNINDRLNALNLLNQLINKKENLSILLREQPELRPFAKEICFGVCRHYIRLEVILEQLSSKKPKDSIINLILLIGLYQLHWLNKPPHASVKETVNLLALVNKNWAKGYVNAVLRTFCREKNKIIQKLESESERFCFNHPDWFVNQVKQDWPLDWLDMLRANDEHPPMSLRVNLSRSTRERYLQDLEQVGITATASANSSTGITLATPCDVNELPGFSIGSVSVQDDSAQLAVSLLALEQGQRVLDACCAPGGKTAHIIEQQLANTSPLKDCVALDINSNRLKQVEANLKRLSIFSQVTLTHADALKRDSWWNGELFDRILLDAPCSATGVIRRHPDLKLLRSPEDIAQITVLQADLLSCLWGTLKPGGRMLYATCSILKKENDEQIEAFLKRHTDCSILPIEKPFGKKTPYGLQLLPGQVGDGFFYSILVKASS